MTERTPRVRERSRRVLEVEDTPTLAPPTTPPPPTDEGRFDYGEAFSATPSIRYRQMKAVEGREPAKQWAKTHILKLSFSGIAVQEIAQTFGFSLKWTEMLITEARRDLRAQIGTEFDGLGVVAEHIAMYRQIRENAFFAMNKNGVSEVDRYRARENLLNIMDKEMAFVEKVGGLRGVSLSSASEDESVLAARAMGERLKHLTEMIEAEFGDDEELLDIDAEGDVLEAEA